MSGNETTIPLRRPGSPPTTGKTHAKLDVTKVTRLMFALSLCLVVVGMLLVLVFLWFLVVPAHGQRHMQWRDCIIVEIAQVNIGTPSDSVQHTQTELSRTTVLYGTPKGPRVKTNVKLSKKKENEALAKDVDVSNTDNPTATDGDTHTYNVFCAMVLVEYDELDTSLDGVDIQGALRKRGLLLHQNTEGSETGALLLQQHKCFCLECDVNRTTNVTTLTYTSGTLRHGEHVPCYMGVLVDSQKNKSTNWALVNAVLWPTLAFITGFVGLFFSGLRLAKENMLRTKRSARTRTPF